MRPQILPLITLTLFAIACNSQLCTSPQKSFYMSYNAISNHDYLADMFENVSQALPTYNLTYTDKNGSVYSILNFKPHLYYNQHRQEEFYVGNVKIKENTIFRTNQLFIEKLQYHLNHEPLVKNSSFTYTYGNISLDYVNVIRDFQLTNGITKGLQAFMQFGFETGAQNCTDLPKEFDQESYGGIQEIISMGIVKTTILKALNMGITNAVLDKKYEVPYFQFFIGDLGNFVDYANKLPAHDPIGISCNLATDRLNELKISRFDEHDLYVQIPEDCVISYKNASVIKVSFDMNLVIRLTAEDDSLVTSILTATVYGDKYYSLDKNFVVTDTYIARYTLTAMLKGLVGKRVFGTGWKLFGRKYPVSRITDDFIVFFDGSEK